MKKVYMKPQIAFEDFSLNVSIARCKYEANTTYGVCGYFDELEGVIFVTKESGCTGVQAPDKEYGNICYDNPDGGYNLFGS